MELPEATYLVHFGLFLLRDGGSGDGGRMGGQYVGLRADHSQLAEHERLILSSGDCRYRRVPWKGR